MKDFQIQAIGLMSGTSLDGLDVWCTDNECFGVHHFPQLLWKVSR